MALKITGWTKVKTLKSDFKTEFGLTIRVYDGRSFADDEATLASIRKNDSKGGELSPKRNMLIGNLEDKIMDLFGIKTQIAGSDDSYLCDNALTLTKALEVDTMKIEKKSKNADKNTEKNIDTDNDETNFKYFKINFDGLGGEYSVGLIEKPEDLIILNNAIENGIDISNEIEAEDGNSLNNLSLCNFSNIAQVFNIRTKNIDEVNIVEVDAEDFTQEITAKKDISKKIKKDSISFRAKDTYLNKDLFDSSNEDCLLWGNISLDSNVQYSVLLKLRDKEAFNPMNLIIAEWDFCDLMADDQVIYEILYMRKEDKISFMAKMKNYDNDVSDFNDKELNDQLSDCLSDYGADNWEMLEPYILEDQELEGDFTFGSKSMIWNKEEELIFEGEDF